MRLIKNKMFKFINISVLIFMLSSVFFLNDVYAEATYKFDKDTGTIIEYDDSIDKTEHVVVPDMIEGVPVKRIGDGAFRGDHDSGPKNKWIKSIKLPNTVVHIGIHSFSNLFNLERIEGLENVEYVGDWAFDRDYSLIFPFENSDKIKELFRYTFFSNKMVPDGEDTIILPKGLEIVNEYTFDRAGGKNYIFGENIREFKGDIYLGADRTWLPNTMVNINNNYLGSQTIIYNKNKKSVLLEQEYNQTLANLRTKNVFIIDAKFKSKVKEVKIKEGEEFNLEKLYGLKHLPALKMIKGDLVETEDKKEFFNINEGETGYSPKIKLSEKELDFYNENFEYEYIKKSLNPDVATLDDNGNIKAIGFGKATFELTSKWNKDVKYKVMLEVEKNPNKIPKIRETLPNSKTVILASAEIYSDALVVSPLAESMNSSLLLVNKDEIPKSIEEELKRINPNKIIIAGGHNTISNRLKDNLEKYYVVERIGGEDRYETSKLIAERLILRGFSRNKVIFASGEVFPDALSVNPYAIKNRIPILLLTKNSMSNYIKKYINNNEISGAIYVGGTNTISKSNEDNILKLGASTIKRFDGIDRYETSKFVADEFNSNMATMASGEIFQDSLCGGVYAGRQNLPILLTTKHNLPNKIDRLIKEKMYTRIDVFGGVNTVSDEVSKVINKLSNGNAVVNRISGLDRYETSVEISKAIFK